MVGQHEFIMRSRTDSKELGSEEDYKEALEDLTYNVDLFLANQEVNVLEQMYVYYSTLSTLW